MIKLRPAADLDLADGLERFQVERRNGVVSPVTSEAAAEIGDHGDAVDPGRVRQLADDLLRVGVHDRDAVPARDVQPLRCGIQC